MSNKRLNEHMLKDRERETTCCYCGYIVLKALFEYISVKQQ